MYTNADNFLNKKSEFEFLIENFSCIPHIIAITEIKPKNSLFACVENEFCFRGYQLFCHGLDNKVSRGVLLYIRDDVAASVIILQSKFNDYVTASIKIGDSKLLLCNIYRSPNSSLENDENLTNLIKEISGVNKNNLLITGDFNFPDIEWKLWESVTGSRQSKAFLKALQDNFLMQHVDVPTRVRGLDTPHLLDLVITDNQFIDSIEYLAPLGKSDHSILMITCDLNVSSSENVHNEHRLNYNKGDYNKLNAFLDIDWDLEFSKCDDDVNKMWNKFVDRINSGIALYIPTIGKFDEIKQKKWKKPLNKGTRINIKQKKKLWKQFIRNRDPLVKIWYNEMTNKVRALTRNQDIVEQNEVASFCKNNPKKFWSYVKRKMKQKSKIGVLKTIDADGNMKEVTADADIAEVLNTFFASVFTVEANKVTDDIHPRNIQHKMSDLIITESDIKQRLSKLNTNKSPGPDTLHPRIFFETKEIIAYPLLYIFKYSMLKCEIPKDWATANISAIHKKGSKSEANNYRPVSLTCVACKLLESIIRDYLVNYFKQNNLFSNRQYGFIKGRSTVLQLLTMLDDWTDKLENGGQIDVIYTDFEKAFDKVPHSRLLNKLRGYGISEALIGWISSFLIDRMQRVRVNGSFSRWVPVLSGIPQGTILGPLLFVIYINDIEDSSLQSSNLFLYADDVKMYKHCNDIGDASRLQADLRVIENWSETWLMKLNINKCKVITYSRNEPIEFNYYINGIKLDRVHTFKDLGVTFDTKLKFTNHVNNVVNKANSVLGVIKRNFQYLSKESFVTLYKAMVRSHLEYAVSVWSPLYQEDVKNLERVQKRATKLIRELKDLPYRERLIELKLPTLKFRRIRGDMIELFKIMTNIYDTCTSLNIPSAPTSIARGNKYKIFQKHVHYKLRQHYFINRVTSVWNSLPDEVVSADNVNTFKHRLDKFWLNQEVIYNWKADIAGSRNRSIKFFEY